RNSRDHEPGVVPPSSGGFSTCGVSARTLEAAVAERLVRWFSFRRNANFEEWLQEQFSDAQLRKLAGEATDCDLFRPWDPWATASNDPLSSVEVERRELSRALINRYGSEIWEIGQVVGAVAGGGGLTGIHCFVHLDLASQVYSLDAFNEFLVRN